MNLSLFRSNVIVVCAVAWAFPSTGCAGLRGDLDLLIVEFMLGFLPDIDITLLLILKWLRTVVIYFGV